MAQQQRIVKPQKSKSNKKTRTSQPNGQLVRVFLCYFLCVAQVASFALPYSYFVQKTILYCLIGLR